MFVTQTLVVKVARLGGVHSELLRGDILPVVAPYRLDVDIVPKVASKRMNPNALAAYFWGICQLAFYFILVFSGGDLTLFAQPHVVMSRGVLNVQPLILL